MFLYCYTDDVKKLIPSGWKFQKLYASNYKTYKKGEVIMFVRGGMIIEIDNVSHEVQADLIDFILNHKDEPESFWHSTRKHSFFKDSLFANWVIQNDKIMSDREAMDNKMKWYKEVEKGNNPEYLSDGHRITYELVQTILELNNLGDIVKKEINP